MPTGYTYPLEERDVHLREFALRCSRALGATIHMRDEDTDVPPRPPEPSAYLRENLKRYKSQLAEAKTMTLAQAKALRDAEGAQREKEKKLSADRSGVLRRRYEALRAEVEAWRPPTQDHDGLKKLMLEQIETCRLDYEHSYEPYMPPPAKKWLAQRIELLEEDVRRTEADIQKEE
ncbi:MAG TPA: hypothetical protein VFA98_12705, partial [Thermoanaerobaculia bacterium]|nr:hypothetical protein [Thermoanaerobaculia bacterium]